MQSRQRVSFPGAGETRWQLPILAKRGCKQVHPRNELEAKPGLHLDHPGTQRVLGLAEVGVQDVSLKVGQIELVKQIVEVGAELKFGVFAQHRQLRYAERLAKSCVDSEVTRPGERVAGNSRNGRQAAKADLTGRTCGSRRIGKETRKQR